MTRSLAFSTTLSIVASSSALCQGPDNLWMGGYATFASPPYGGSDIDFSTGSPVISLQSRTIDLYQTAASIGDSLGDLLFFSNGVVVGNALGDTMLNGTGLNPSDYTDSWYPEGLGLYQANLMIPAPSDAGRFYLFHNTIDILPDFVPQYLYVSKIDMDLDGGNGAVVSKNQVIFNGDVQPGHLTAVRHGNGRDWWVYAHEFNNNTFLRWLLTPQGLTGPITQSVGTYRARPRPGSLFTRWNSLRILRRRDRI